MEACGGGPGGWPAAGSGWALLISHELAGNKVATVLMATSETTRRQRGSQMQQQTPTKLLKRPATSRWEKDEDLELLGHDHVSSAH